MVFQTHSQLVVTDPGSNTNQGIIISQNATQIGNMVNSLKEMKELKDQAIETKEEILKIKAYYDTMEERLKSMGGIKGLKMANINAILDRILCLTKGQEVNYKSMRFQYIIDNFVNSLMECNHEKAFEMTYGGIRERLSDKPYGVKKLNIKMVYQKMKEINSSIFQANQINDAITSAGKKQNMEIAYRYSALGNELIEIGRELYEVAKYEGDGSVELTRGERINLIGKGIEYQAKGMEYIEKSNALMKESTSMSAQDNHVIRKEQRSLLVRELSRIK